MIGIVVSRADEASVHIGERLLEGGSWTEREDPDRPADAGGGTVHRTEGFELRTFADLHLELADAAAAFDDPRFLVFVSRHAGETGPLLTAHFTGNFGPAEYGGASGELAAACPAAAKRVLGALDDHAPEGYDVGLECTHHGPSAVGAPSMFVELGSAEEQWRDPAGARAVARAVLDLRGAPARDERTVVGFGGGHYAPRATRIARDTDWAVGHVAADWALADLDEPAERRDVIERAFAASGADRAVIDGERPALEATVEELGHRVVGETWLRETGGVPLATVGALEEALVPVGAGLRFGARAADADTPDSFLVAALPEELLAAAHGIDAAATREAVAGVSLAYETAEAGNRVVGRVAVRDRADWDRLVDGLVAVLARGYDRVERREGRIVATETAFDPAAARDRGVPEGPAFGRLADGESVTVDGTEIAPGDVSEERTVEFPLPAPASV